MDSKTPVSYDDVAAAANAITAEGGRASLRNVRERIGRGSLGTVQKHMLVWSESRSQDVQATVALPGELQRVILEYVQREVVAATSRVQAELLDARQSIETLVAESEGQSNLIQDLMTEAAAQRGENQQQAGRISQLESDLVVANARADSERVAAESARTELAKANLRLEMLPKLEAEIERVGISLDVEKKRANDAERTLSGIQAELVAAREMMASMRELATRDQTALAKVEKDLAAERQKAEVALAKEREHNNQYRNELTTLKVALQKSEDRAQMLEDRLAAELPVKGEIKGKRPHQSE